MLAALAAAPEVALTGMSAALIVATAVTALVALGMMMLALHRRARLTIVKSGASVLAGLAVVAIAVVGVVAVSPAGAEAAPDAGLEPSTRRRTGPGHRPAAADAGPRRRGLRRLTEAPGILGA